MDLVLRSGFEQRIDDRTLVDLVSVSVCKDQQSDGESLRSRLGNKLEPIQFAKACLWYHDVPGMAWRIDRDLVSSAFDRSGIVLGAAWEKKSWDR